MKTKCLAIWIVLLFSLKGYCQSYNSVEGFRSSLFNDIKKIKKESDAIKFGKEVSKRIAQGNDVLTFLSALPSSSEYEPVVEFMKIQTSINRGPITATYTKTISEYTRHKTSDRFKYFSETMTNLGRAASVFNILEAVNRDSNGDKKGKAEAIKATYDLISGELLTKFELAHVGLAIKPIDYALNKVLSTALKTNEELVYNAYELYMNEKVSKSEWWDLYKSNNTTQIQNILFDKFWDSGYSDEYLDRYMKENNISRSVIDRTGLVASKQDVRKKFGKKYFKENINNYIVRKKREALLQDRLRIEGIMAGYLGELQKTEEEAARLQRELEAAKKAMYNKVEELSKEDVLDIIIVPDHSSTELNKEIKFEVLANLKEGEISNITDECSFLSEIDFSTLGLKDVVAKWEGFFANTTVSIEQNPEIIINPSYYIFDINDDIEVNFTVDFLNKYNESLTISAIAFEKYETHPNDYNYINVGEYLFEAEYIYENNVYKNVAKVEITGCEDPDRILDKSSGECICDAKSGFIENDEGECSKFKSIKLNPLIINGSIGDQYAIEVIGVTPKGEEKVIHKFSEYIADEGRNTYTIDFAGYSAQYTVISSKCGSERQYVDDDGKCQCKDEYIEDEGKCLTLIEIEDRAREESDGGQVDCKLIIDKMMGVYHNNLNKINQSISRFNNHAELAIKLLNDRLSDACNNSAFANSLKYARESNEEIEYYLQGMRGTFAELWGEGGYQCPELILTEEEYIEPLFDRMKTSINTMDYLNEKWLEFNCKNEELDDLNPFATNDPSRDPAGNIVGGSGTDFPGDGIDNDGDGLSGMGSTPSPNPPPGPNPSGNNDYGLDQNDNLILEQCLNFRGYNINNIASQIEDLFNDQYVTAVTAWNNDPDNIVICRELRRVLEEIASLYSALKSCLLEAGILSYPNGQDVISGIDTVLTSFNPNSFGLQC